MAGDTPREATAAFREPIEQTIGCVWNGHHYIQTSPRQPGALALVVNRSQPIDLRCEDDSRLRLLISIHFEHKRADGEHGPWKVHTLEYIYAFSLPDEDKHPFLSYHWHPLLTPEVDYPHLHIRDADSGPLTHHSHVPTGRISVEQVVRLAITQFNVRTLRKDWSEALEQIQARYEEFKTW